MDITLLWYHQANIASKLFLYFYNPILTVLKCKLLLWLNGLVGCYIALAIFFYVYQNLLSEFKFLSCSWNWGWRRSDSMLQGRQTSQKVSFILLLKWVHITPILTELIRRGFVTIGALSPFRENDRIGNNLKDNFPSTSFAILITLQFRVFKTALKLLAEHGYVEGKLDKRFILIISLF